MTDQLHMFADPDASAEFLRLRQQLAADDEAASRIFDAGFRAGRSEGMRHIARQVARWREALPLPNDFTMPSWPEFEALITGALAADLAARPGAPACTVLPIAMPDRRFSIDEHSGDVFAEDDDYLGTALTLEIKTPEEAEAVLAALREAQVP